MCPPPARTSDLIASLIRLRRGRRTGEARHPLLPGLCKTGPHSIQPGQSPGRDTAGSKGPHRVHTPGEEKRKGPCCLQLGCIPGRPLSTWRTPRLPCLTNPASAPSSPPRLLGAPRQRRGGQGSPQQPEGRALPKPPRARAAASGGGEAAAHTPRLPGRPGPGWGDGSPELNAEAGSENTPQTVVLDQLTPGALGVNLVVEERKSKGRLVLKQVECLDDHHANEALEELMPLLKLRHAHISIYREMFITWNRQRPGPDLPQPPRTAALASGARAVAPGQQPCPQQTSALLLCLVMDYSKGSFQKVIEKKREAREVIDWEWMHNVLGQVLDALEFLHRLDIVHRNLKPSNVALVSRNHCKLQDLSAAALMTHKAKWTIRAEEDPFLKSWMAPEALEFTFTQKADVWSLGCIILDMVSCSFLGATEAMLLRKAIRSQPGDLRGVLKMVQERRVPHASAFCCLLPEMLQVNPLRRITVRDIIRRALESSNFRSPKDTPGPYQRAVPEFVLRILLEGHVASILEVMHNFPRRPEVQLKVMDKLLTMPDDQLGLPWPTEQVDELVAIMKQHQSILDIQLRGCSLLLRTLGQALAQDPDEEAPRDSSMVSFLLTTMRTHPEARRLTVTVYGLLTVICSQGRATEEMQRAGLLEHVVGRLGTWSDHRDVCLASLRLLWTLLVDVDTESKGLLKKAPASIAELLAAYPEDADIAEAGCAVLWLLSMLGCIEAHLFEEVVSLLLQSIRLRQDKVLLVNSAYRALAGLAQVSELAALQVVVPEARGSGLALIRETYARHRDDPEVVENVCRLLAQLASYRDILYELAISGIGVLLQEIKERFSSSLELVSYAESVLLRLGEAGPPCSAGGPGALA
ncbi:serine/threonine kinase-like domain-containing protein STKLD1 isoform 2-T2 [Glossophaga mutica]